MSWVSVVVPATRPPKPLAASEWGRNPGRILGKWSRGILTLTHKLLSAWQHLSCFWPHYPEIPLAQTCCLFRISILLLLSLTSIFWGVGDIPQASVPSLCPRIASLMPGRMLIRHRRQKLSLSFPLFPTPLSRCRGQKEGLWLVPGLGKQGWGMVSVAGCCLKGVRGGQK